MKKRPILLEDPDQEIECAGDDLRTRIRQKGLDDCAILEVVEEFGCAL